MQAVGVEPFQDALQLGQPRDGQVAVLQADPLAIAGTLVNVLPGKAALALAERAHAVLAIHAVLAGKRQEHGGWIGTGAEHEDDGGGVGGVLEGAGQIETGGISKGGTEGLEHLKDHDD